MSIKKLLQNLSLSSPLRKRRVFFIYTHNTLENRFAHGLKANTEISYFCLKALQKSGLPVTFLRLQNEKEWRIRQITKKDIVIGHPGETYRKACQQTDNIIAFHPWCGHEDRSTSTTENCSPLQEELDDLAQAKSIIFLTSEYNVLKYSQTKTNFWFDYLKTKPVRFVHQPIDLNLFTRIKTSYGIDDFLYVGNNLHMKCLDEAKQLVKEVNRQFTIYGVEKKLNNLDQTAVKRLIHEADFFIQPGMWEAQCVSILEAAARGFIPVVTKETGYPYDHPYLLKYGDHEYNLKTLRKLLKTSKEERRELADHLHQCLVEDPHHNNWDQMTDVLVEEVQKLARDKALC